MVGGGDCGLHRLLSDLGRHLLTEESVVLVGAISIPLLRQYLYFCTSKASKLSAKYLVIPGTMLLSATWISASRAFFQRCASSRDLVLPVDSKSVRKEDTGNASWVKITQEDTVLPGD